MRVPVSLLSIIGLSSGQTCTDLPTKSPSAFDTEFYEYACTINARVEKDKITDNTTVCATVKTRWEATVTSTKMHFTKDFENTVAPKMDSDGRYIVPYSVKLQLIDAAFKYDQSPTEADFVTEVNNHLRDYYVDNDFFDKISVDPNGCTQTDFKPLASSDISPVTAELDKFQDAAKVSGQVKLDKAFATEPKPLFIYDEATVGPDASSYEKNLIVSKLNDEVVPDVFQQPDDAEFKYYEYTLSKDTADPEVILLDYTAYYAPIGENATQLSEAQTEQIRLDVESKFNDYVNRGDSFISSITEAPTAEYVPRQLKADEIYRANIITLCVTLAVAALLVILIGAVVGVAYKDIQKQVRPPVGVGPSGLTVKPLDTLNTFDTTRTATNTMRF